MEFSKGTPFNECVTLSDSDDEVFVGPVTEKEKQKAARLNRRTQVFFPPISWKLRSSNQSSVGPKEPYCGHQTFNFPEGNASDSNRLQVALPRKSNELRHSPYLREGRINNVKERHLSGYAADISTGNKTDALIEADSLEAPISIDSLNSLSKDSLNTDNDSSERSEQPASTSQVSDHSSATEDLYDVKDYLLNLGPSRNTVPTPEKRFSLDMEELQKQLETFAADVHNDHVYTAKKLVSSPEKLDASTGSILSPYDLNKQKLTSSLLYDSRIDSSPESNPSPAENKLDTVNEVSEPSSTDFESRLSKIHLTETKAAPCMMSPSNRPRMASCRSTPKHLKLKTTRTSTQLFEEFERQFEEEERFSGRQDPQNSYTVSTEEASSFDDSLSSRIANVPHQTTYTVSSSSTSVQSFTYNVSPGNDAEIADSVNSSHHAVSADSSGQMSDCCPDGEFNDTLEEYEMLMKYGVDYIYGKQKGVLETCQKKLSHGVESSAQRRSADSVASHGPSSEYSTSNSVRRGKESTPLKGSSRTPMRSVSCGKLTPASKTPNVFHAGCAPQSEGAKVRRALSQRSPATKQYQDPTRSSPLPHSNKLNDAAGKKFASSADSSTPGNPKFKVPTKIPLSACRTPRTHSAVGPSTPSRPTKFLNAVQSPVGAYIHKSPALTMIKNIKPKTCPSSVPREQKKQHHVWEKVDALRKQTGESSENVNPNIGHGLRAIHYTRAPCIKLDEPSLPKPRLPRLGERFEKLLDSPCPQVTKHEGRVRVNPSSPQYTAAVKAVRSNLNESARSEGTADTSAKWPSGIRQIPSQNESSSSSGFGDSFVMSSGSDSSLEKADTLPASSSLNLSVRGRLKFRPAPVALSAVEEKVEDFRDWSRRVVVLEKRVEELSTDLATALATLRVYQKLFRPEALLRKCSHPLSIDAGFVI